MIPHLSAFDRRRTAAHTAAFIAAAGCLALRVHPPDTSPLYPVCPFYRVFHLLCPGCGATRALSALLRGHLTEAIHANALFVVLLPLLLAYAAIVYRRALAPGHLRWPAIPRAITAALLAVAAGFAVLRNLPAFHL